MAVPIQPRRSFAAGKPQQVFEGPYLAPLAFRTYDVSADGQRLLMIKRAAAEEGPTLVVVQNWFEELRQRVPTH